MQPLTIELGGGNDKVKTNLQTSMGTVKTQNNASETHQENHDNRKDQIKYSILNVVKEEGPIILAEMLNIIKESIENEIQYKLLHPRRYVWVPVLHSSSLPQEINPYQNDLSILINIFCFS